MAECGTADPDGGATTLPAAPSRKKRDLTKCKKCPDGSPKVLLRLQDPYCRECFFYGVHKKARSDIGKHRILQQHEEVMLAFSGGNRSSTLLGVIHKFMSNPDHRQMRINPTVFHIDDTLAHRDYVTDEDRRVRLENIAALTKQLGFQEVQSVRLESLYGDGTEAEASLQAVIQGCKSLTAQQDMIRLLKRQLLLASARRLGCTKIMVGSCHDQLAMNILTDLSSGRGGNMTKQSTFAEKLDGVTIVRPLRKVSSREAGFYNHFNNIRPYVPKIRGAHAPDKASFERLIQAFVAELLVNFPSTAAAVFRTSEKIEMARADELPECVLCNGPVEPMPTARAQITSQGGIKDVRGLFQVEAAQLHGDNHEIDTQPLDLINMLCHGCRSTAMDMQQGALHLPTNVTKDVLSRPRHSLEDVLSEFQLDGDET
eukprot:TRINITY_DN10949_c0_g3_i3.p1 TRINITY_DN10949_c0_g3~~TRINITY_DN10949_c0_g3_i3.p1  ORF type:complete len:428 (+),score=84.03 TRINITY_DN10949_c0_g3_i3:31-1314(+)